VVGYAVHAVLRSPDRGWGYVALVLAGVEFVGWCLILAAQPIFFVTVSLSAGVIFAVKQVLDQF
jgi:hypothetical protein